MSNRDRELPGKVGEVQIQIEQWRQTRTKQCAMPMELWRAAAELAKAHGINPISQVLRLSYESLKTHVARLGDAGAKPVQESPSGFVEVTGMDVLQPRPRYPVEVEVDDGQGKRLVIRLGGGVDMGSLLADFWKQHR